MASQEGLWGRICAALSLATQITLRQLGSWVQQGRVCLTQLALTPLFRQWRQEQEAAVAARSQLDGSAPARDPGSELIQASVLLRLKVDSLLRSALPLLEQTVPSSTADAPTRAEDPIADWAEPDLLDAAGESGQSQAEGTGFDPARWRARLQQAEELQRLAASLGRRHAQERERLPRGQPEPMPVRRLFVQPLGPLRPVDLQRVWLRVQERLSPPADPPIFRAEASWRSLVPRLVHVLRHQGELLLQTWTQALAKPEQVAAFLAFLELVRRGRAKGVQSAPTEPIRVFWVADSGSGAGLPGPSRPGSS